MLYCLSFAPEFFWGTVPIEKMRPSSRPASVYQAALSLKEEEWAVLARDVFNCPPDNLTVETIVQRVLETNTCRNLGSPVDVLIDPEGWYSVLVYEEKP